MTDESKLLDEVYASAQWALRCGITKERILYQIAEALAFHRECLEEKMKGWLIGQVADESDED